MTYVRWPVDTGRIACCFGTITELGMSLLRMMTVAVPLLLTIGGAEAQVQQGQIEMVKPERCAVGRLQSVDPVRCFAWATAAKSGGIDEAEARCTNPEFVPLAKRCLNNHRIKKEHSGAEQKVCVEFTYVFGQPDNYFGAKMKSSVNYSRVLPDCAITVAPY